MKRLLSALQPVKVYFITISALFVLAGLYGYSSETMHGFLQQQMQGLEKVAKEINEAENKYSAMFLFIFFNNAIKSIVFMYAGLLFGLLPFVFIIVNGMMVGYVLRMLEMEGANVGEFVVKGLLPHGIIEIPILLLASAYGVMLGFSVVRKMFSLRKEIPQEPVQLIKRSGYVAVFITFALLVAAFVEAFVSTALLQG